MHTYTQRRHAESQREREREYTHSMREACSGFFSFIQFLRVEYFLMRKRICLWMVPKIRRYYLHS
jgi:hypothetical protein